MILPSRVDVAAASSTTISPLEINCFVEDCAGMMLESVSDPQTPSSELPLTMKLYIQVMGTFVARNKMFIGSLLSALDGVFDAMWVDLAVQKKPSQTSIVARIFLESPFLVDLLAIIVSQSAGAPIIHDKVATDSMSPTHMLVDFSDQLDAGLNQSMDSCNWLAKIVCFWLQLDDDAWDGAYIAVADLQTTSIHRPPPPTCFIVLWIVARAVRWMKHSSECLRPNDTSGLDSSSLNFDVASSNEVVTSNLLSQEFNSLAESISCGFDIFASKFIALSLIAHSVSSEEVDEAAEIKAAASRDPPSASFISKEKWRQMWIYCLDTLIDSFPSSTTSLSSHEHSKPSAELAGSSCHEFTDCPQMTESLALFIDGHLMRLSSEADDISASSLQAHTKLLIQQRHVLLPHLLPFILGQNDGSKLATRAASHSTTDNPISAKIQLQRKLFLFRSLAAVLESNRWLDASHILTTECVLYLSLLHIHSPSYEWRRVSERLMIVLLRTRGDDVGAKLMRGIAPPADDHFCTNREIIAKVVEHLPRCFGAGALKLLQYVVDGMGVAAREEQQRSIVMMRPWMNSIAKQLIELLPATVDNFVDFGLWPGRIYFDLMFELTSSEWQTHFSSSHLNSTHPSQDLTPLSSLLLWSSLRSSNSDDSRTDVAQSLNQCVLQYLMLRIETSIANFSTGTNGSLILPQNYFASCNGRQFLIH